jgi:thiol-disulfide isomerase/thioredoxin
MRARPPRILRAAAALVALAVLAGCSGAGGGRPGTGNDDRYISGDGTVTELSAADRKPAPELSGSTLDGKTIDVADLRGKVVVVNVWASWCPPCRAEAPALERVWRATRSEGVQFIGLNTRDQSAAAESYVRSKGISYPSVDANDGRALLALRGTLPPTAIPSTLVLDREGRVAARVLGGVTEPQLRQLIDSVLAETQP